MKRIIKYTFIILAAGLVFNACKKDFLDVNVNPKAASIDQV